jgi:hypothetical protein
MAAQAFRASPRPSAIRLRVFLLVSPALERCLNAFPEAQNKTSITCDDVIRARICSPRNGVNRPILHSSNFAKRMPQMGHSRPGRASNKSGHVGYTPEAKVIQSIGFIIEAPAAAQWRRFPDGKLFIVRPDVREQRSGAAPRKRPGPS